LIADFFSSSAGDVVITRAFSCQTDWRTNAKWKEAILQKALLGKLERGRGREGEELKI